MKVTKPILASWVAFTLILGSFVKQVNARPVVTGGSTGWNSVSTTNLSLCQDKAFEKMNTLVAAGEIQRVVESSSRFARGNNAVFSVHCSPDGKNVMVDIICWNSCEREVYNLRSKIDEMMKW